MNQLEKYYQLKLILQEYLKNDYILDDDDEIADGINKNQYINIKNLLKKDLFETKEQKILESDELENDNDFKELINSDISENDEKEEKEDNDGNENIKSITNEL